MPNPTWPGMCGLFGSFPFQPEGRANVLLGQVFRWRVTFTLAPISFGPGIGVSKRASNSSHPCIPEDFRRGRERSSVHARNAKKIAGQLARLTRTAGDYWNLSDRILS